MDLGILWIHYFQTNPVGKLPPNEYIIGSLSYPDLPPSLS